VVASKFGLPIDGERFGAHPQYVKRACEDSLRRLGFDYLDLYQLHIPDDNVPIADTLRPCTTSSPRARFVKLAAPT
jgi:aryl-alcohol dehydrogenase-like predicted oxidoreductase